MELLPREKLIKLGAEALNDDELLAIMLGTGTNTESVFEMSKRLCDTYGFERLYHMSYDDLSAIPGIKKAKASKLMAVFEIVKRIMESENKEIKLSSSHSIFEYVYPKYLGKNKEILTIIYVNSKLGVLKLEEYTSDSYTSIDTPIRTIVKNSIANDAYGVFLIHNHPAGNVNPSESDIKYTHRLEFALSSIGILLLDHIIISKNKYYSFSDSKRSGNPFDF